MTSGVWAAALIALQAGPAPPPDKPAETTELIGEVVDTMGRPVPRVNVFAVGSGEVRVRGTAVSDANGQFRMTLASRPHEFGIMSARWLLASFVRIDVSRLKLSVVPALVGGGDPGQVVRDAKEWIPVIVRPKDRLGARDQAILSEGLSVGVLSGRVLDETGTGLAGVKLFAVNGHTMKLTTAAATDAHGHYTLVTRAGPNRIFVFAPGLKVQQALRPAAGTLDVVMAIDAGAQSVTVFSGRMLRFRMSDSIWPEYLPPPEAVAELRFSYGINVNSNFCPGDLVVDGLRPPTGVLPPDGSIGSLKIVGVTCPSPGEKCPPTVWQRQCKVPKYWWLRILQTTPPNPAHRRERWWEELMLEMQEAEAQDKKTRK